MKVCAKFHGGSSTCWADYSATLLLAQLQPYWCVPHTDSVINTWQDVQTLMYIVPHKCKTLPPSNHKACPIRPSLMSLVSSDKAMYGTCMYDTHIFITLITPAAVIIPACFWFIMYSSPENRGIVWFFFPFPDLKYIFSPQKSCLLSEFISTSYCLCCRGIQWTHVCVVTIMQQCWKKVSSGKPLCLHVLWMPGITCLV